MRSMALPWRLYSRASAADVSYNHSCFVSPASLFIPHGRSGSVQSFFQSSRHPLFADMPSFAASSLFLDRFVHLLVGAMEEIDLKREPLIPSSSKPLSLARYALGVTLAIDIAAMLALGCWLFARSPALPDPSMAFNESLVIILSGFSLAFAYAFYLGAGPPVRRGPLATLASAYTPVDFWLLAAALLTIATGFVLVFLHRGFRDGERALVGGIYQILLHSAGILIIGLPGYSSASDPEYRKREIPSAFLLGSWMVLAICFGLIQVICADYNFTRHRWRLLDGGF